MSVRLMTLVWKSTVPAPEKFTLLALADYADDGGGSCFPSIAAVAAKCSTRERTVYRHLAALKDLGVLAVEHRSGRNSTYLISPARLRELAREAVDDGGDGSGELGRSGRDTSPNPAAPADHPGQSVRGTPDNLTGSPDNLTPVTVIEPSRHPPSSLKSSPPSRPHPDGRGTRETSKIDDEEARRRRQARRDWELPANDQREWLDPRNLALAEQIEEWVDCKYGTGADSANAIQSMVDRGYTPMRVLNKALKDGREVYGIGPTDPIPGFLLNATPPDTPTPVWDDGSGDQSWVFLAPIPDLETLSDEQTVERLADAAITGITQAWLTPAAGARQKLANAVRDALARSIPRATIYRQLNDGLQRVGTDDSQWGRLAERPQAA